MSMPESLKLSLTEVSLQAQKAHCRFRLFRLRLAQPVFWLACLIAGTSMRAPSSKETIKSSSDG